MTTSGYPTNRMPEWITYPERQIIEAVVTEALARNLRVSVFDGEAWSLVQSGDFGRITAEIGATDTTTLRFWVPADRSETGKAQPVGSVFLVHGNGSDVLSDWSDNGTTEAVLARAKELAETFNAAGC